MYRYVGFIRCPWLSDSPRTPELENSRRFDPSPLCAQPSAPCPTLGLPPETGTPNDLGVPWGDPLVGPVVLLVRVGAVGADEVHVARDDQREDLLARPQGLGLQDGRHGHLPVPDGQEHQDRHHLVLGYARG